MPAMTLLDPVAKPMRCQLPTRPEPAIGAQRKAALFRIIFSLENAESGVARGRLEGIERGIEAQRALLRGQVSLKFGAVTAQGLSPLLAVVSQTETLVRVGGWIIECTTGDELLDRVRSLTNGGVDEAPGRAFD